MKQKLSNLCKLALAFCMMLGVVVPTTVSAADEAPGDGVTVEGMHVNKTAKLEADGTYTIDLEAYAEGEVKTITTTKNVPCDIVMVLDQSGSMHLSMEHDPLPSKSYTYNNWGIETEDGKLYETEYFYKDGEYYRNVLLWDYPGNDNYYVDFYGEGGTIYYFTKNGSLTTNISEAALTADDVFYEGVLYKKSGSRLDVLKKSAKKFVEQVQMNANENAVDHRIALTTFSQNGSLGWNGTGIYDGSTFVKYAQDNNATSSDITKEQYQASLVDVRENKANLDQAIDSLSSIGFTYANYGMELANNVLDARDVTTFEGPDGSQVERSKIVVFFTDGIPGNERVGQRFSEYNDSIITANATIKEADKLKAEGAKVFSIAVLNGANPENKYDFIEGSHMVDDVSYNSYETADKAINAYLHYVSSDWSEAVDMLTPPRDTIVNNGFYFAAKNASELDKIFETITGSLDETETKVTLDEKAVIRDVISKEFKLPEGFNANDNVIVKTAKYTGNETWATPVVETKMTVNVKNDNTIDVSGFSYKDNYVAEEIPGKYPWSKPTPAKGKMLMVTIKGVLANDKTNGENIKTNKSTSGVYSNGDGSGILVAPFPEPTVNLPEKSYVLDYGKPVSVATDEILGKGAKALAIDTGYNKQDTASYTTFAKKDFGTSTLKDEENVTYAPGKINWNGIDRYAVLAELDNKQTASYEWSAVNFIPANSVYYEDDFAQVEGNTDSNVSIIYGGKWDEVKGKNDSNQSSDNIVYGKDGSYNEEKGYSDGGVHSAKSGATATFTFTGTGVDIYSSTDSDACNVYAFLYDQNNVMIKYALCDNFGADGKYYTVPTIAFEGLEHGTYKVELLVSASQTRPNPDTQKYYLDGIRVYNPLGNVTDDGSKAGDAYKEAGELNAVFTEVRSMLLSGDAGVEGIEGKEGMLYFDQIQNEAGEVDSSIATYKKVGPEHEAYLSKGNGIAFTMNNFNAETDNVYVGIKLVRANSKDASVEITNGKEKMPLTINSTADTYFEITPDSNGNVAIKNTSDTVVSVTKVRTTTSTENNEITFISGKDTTVSYISSFNDLPVTGEDVEQPDDGKVTIGDILNGFKDALDKIKDWFGKWGK